MAEIINLSCQRNRSLLEVLDAFIRHEEQVKKARKKISATVMAKGSISESDLVTYVLKQSPGTSEENAHQIAQEAMRTYRPGRLR